MKINFSRNIIIATRYLYEGKSSQRSFILGYIFFFIKNTQISINVKSGAVIRGYERKSYSLSLHGNLESLGKPANLSVISAN